MSNDKVLSDKEIDNIWESIKSISPDGTICMLKSGVAARTMTMSNGYSALLSLDVHKDDIKEYHLSISNPMGIVKFEIAAAMARDILGDCDQLHVGFRGIYHFVKNADEGNIHKTNENKENNKGKNKEAKLKHGKEFVEGDVSNGNEGRVKKEIQIEGVIERPNR